MDNGVLTFLTPLRCKESTLHLACVWILGLISGIFFSLSSRSFPSSDVCSAACIPASPVGLLSAVLLPVLFSAFAVYISRPKLLIPIAFCKAFLFSFLSFRVLVSFGSAGWLIHLLFMFSDILTMPILWAFWQKGLASGRNSALRCLIPVCITAVLVGCIEYRFISPFLAKVLSL